MRFDFADGQAAPFPASRPDGFAVECESDPLTHVLLCPPSHLRPVPCCSKTRESMREGFTVSTAAALRQHDGLREALVGLGVTCSLLSADSSMPDLCFTRDAVVTTPWGVVLLNPAKRHRAPEVDHVASSLARIGIEPVARIRDGHIEGGDICIAKPGLLIIGISRERTDEDGARSFARRFRQSGWDVVHCPLDPHFLHLDTIFCMLDRRRALACVDVLDDGFLSAMAARGIELIPTYYKEARNLGGNILSIDGKRIVMTAAYPRIARELRSAGYEPLPLDVSQFTACGGGIHCLTMPLRRHRDRPPPPLSLAP